MKNYHEPIRNQICDLPAYRAVPHQTAPLHPLILKYYSFNFIICVVGCAFLRRLFGRKLRLDSEPEFDQKQTDSKEYAALAENI
jgi:hypothetical protein